MCGIFGYAGRHSAPRYIYDGLKRLEYRGYDSWGIAVLKDSQIVIHKEVGVINNPDIQAVLPKSFTGIGHTRWATHGGVTVPNAHPHFSSDHSFVVAHNGIVENFEELKNFIVKKGYDLQSETDTEIIVHLIEEEKKNSQSFLDAIQKAFAQLHGRNTIIVLENITGNITAVRNGSPLVIGKNVDTGEIFFSSDTYSFAPWVTDISVVDNQQLIFWDAKKQKLSGIDLKQRQPFTPKFQPLDVENLEADKEGFDHFMLKEIFDTPYTINQVANQKESSMNLLAKAILSAANVYTIGSGTAGLAAELMTYYFRTNAQINARALVGAEAVEYYPLFSPNDILIAPSQSGETADVLEVLEIAKAKGATIVSYVNMLGSTMSRMSDFAFQANAGPEICVMSTKIFTSQISWGYLLSKSIIGEFDQAKKNLQDLSSIITDYLANDTIHASIKDLAAELKDSSDIFLLGKGQNLPIVKEAMVKLIEGSYVHAHAMPAGDLKHYAITLMEKGVPVIVVISKDTVQADITNAANEVSARGASIIGFAPENQPLFAHHIKTVDTHETSAIFNIIPIQLLAYYLAKQLGRPIDKPRNIAKSVTVK